MPLPNASVDTYLFFVGLINLQNMRRRFSVCLSANISKFKDHIVCDVIHNFRTFVLLLSL